jgi:hypothetical protein
MIVQAPPVLLKSKPAELQQFQVSHDFLRQRIQNVLQYQQQLLARHPVRHPGNVVGPVNNGPIVIQGRRPARAYGGSPVPLATPFDSSSPGRVAPKTRFKHKTGTLTTTKRRRRNGKQFFNVIAPVRFSNRKKKYYRLGAFQF